MFKKQRPILTISDFGAKASLQRISKAVADYAKMQPLSPCSLQQTVEVPLYWENEVECGKIEVLLRVSYNPYSIRKTTTSSSITGHSTPRCLYTPTVATHELTTIPS